MKDPHDNATPSAGAVAVTALFRLAKLTGCADLLPHAEVTMRLSHALMEQHPGAAAQMLIAADFWLGPVREFAVLGSGEGVHRILRAIHGRFIPNKVVAGGSAPLPLLENRDTGPTGARLYVCENFACQAPLDGPEAAEAALTGL
jgi:uncharacterized protein YyaL (SSP411 family)